MKEGEGCSWRRLIPPAARSSSFVRDGNAAAHTQLLPLPLLFLAAFSTEASDLSNRLSKFALQNSNSVKNSLLLLSTISITVSVAPLHVAFGKAVLAERKMRILFNACSSASPPPSPSSALIRRSIHSPELYRSTREEEKENEVRAESKERTNEVTGPANQLQQLTRIILRPHFLSQ